MTKENIAAIKTLYAWVQRIKASEQTGAARREDIATSEMDHYYGSEINLAEAEDH